MLHPRRLTGLIVLALLGVIPALVPEMSPANAAKKEPPAVTAFLDLFAQRFGVRPVYRKYRTAEDGTVTLRGFTTEQTPADPNAVTEGTNLSADTVAFSGVEATANGLLDVAEVKLTNLIFFYSDGEGAATALRLPEATISHLLLRPSSPGSPSTTPDGSTQSLLKSVTAPRGVLSSGGISLPIGEIRSTLEGDPVAGTGHYEISISDIHYPASAISHSDPSGTVLSLVGGDLVLDLSVTGENHMTGTARQGTFDAMLGVHSVGNLRLSGHFDGSPDTRLASIAEGDSARLAVVSPFIQPVTISDFSLRYEDLSGARKLISMLAADQNIEASVLVSSAVSSLEQVFTVLNNPALTDHITAAVKTFLSDPKSLTVRSSPVHPVPMPAIVRGFTNDPVQLMNQLSVSVTAND